MAFVYLGLGANQGDSADTVLAAFRRLEAILDEARLSRLWRSRARYVADQPDFVNAVACGRTDSSPRELLRSVNAIEADFGRDRGKERPKGPRPLDIDILLYDELLVVEPDLIIPHPGLAERKFVLLPLLELAPDLVHPATGEPLLAIVESLPPQGIYLVHAPRYDRLYI
ncbi:MAG TPA: 2-amino-4-hydroxy-6-hydroxymethyldihydropteridine diphosphokinase [Rectinemataceae bacterium]|nr:2-amino-4-hydroxy-6-hydroxymethyldihydropteridine diphosphokinase [Rectinemataceae bacterium]